MEKDEAIEAALADRAPHRRAEPVGLSGWVHKLGESGMPVFAHTARDISLVSDSSNSSAAELARVVLQDAAMTAKLLRVANSPIFNPMGRTISTVSRAVVVLGFQEVRSICLSIAVVESMLRGKQKQHVSEEMARSFHAAVQARSFARKRRDRSPEEVFIATLLFRLGDMAFWAFAGEAAEKMDAAVQQRPGEAAEQVQQDVLGFRFRDLTLGLSREWKLGALLEQALEGKTDRNPRAGNVALGYELALAAEQGWETPEVGRLVERLAENLYLPVEEVEQLVQANAEEAANTAAFYGADRAGELIPVPGERRGTRAAGDIDTVEVPVFPQPDPVLQLGILRELSALMDSRPDFNSVLEMVLEGMYRGVGMDRTLFALRTPDHRMLVARYALGSGNEQLLGRFRFETVEGETSLFARVIESKQAVWVGAGDNPEIEQLVTPPVQEVSQGAGFFVTPIEIHGKVIGVFYADRQPSGRPLDEDSYTAFRHFAQQGNLALAYLSSS
ncbi:MAG TPA: HDOD domain-containing protein [Gammaproteobacteria bacterium]|nr:HDOD domain-containing protein [Gammaproteobacteria bacterium]